ncbi:helix-turn-helix domain-containing protein [Affinibrenneria salicis]|uniref:Helix-turn-helix domain-containing protein n=1 Tax=Affinibrenneria salicis TaxID=2590031 RepID=A0A5J5FYY4_9GAMM|nr:XRE family transcriptional regulator [Affinibrenneria salicis]KAA8999440.1 helix-turn-helix domain-containing protein [Affinibrenneria salicis]
MKTTKQHETTGLGSALTNEKDFGARIKAIRMARNYTLDQLAEMSTVSISTLSKIENGQVSASFDTIAKIAGAFDYSLAELFSARLPAAAPASPGVTGRRTFTRAGKGLVFSSAWYRYDVHATELLAKGMIPVLMDIRAREVPPRADWSMHEGEEFIYVLEGCVMLHTAYYAPLTLNRGDSAYIDSTMSHAFVSLSEGEARLLSICLTEEIDFSDMTVGRAAAMTRDGA